MLDMLLIGFFSFLKNSIGLVVRPYETMRRIIQKGTFWEIIPIGVVLSLYFSLASLVKTPFFRPFLLTRHFVKLSFSVAITSLFVACVFWSVATLWGRKGEFRQFFIGWMYTLLPTVSWFFLTSLLYVILPPPRTTQFLGICFSVFYLTISAAVLFWKIILSYLALRFGMRLDLGKIIGIAIIAGPIIGFYSFVMYRLGIFKVPFI